MASLALSLPSENLYEIRDDATKGRGLFARVSIPTFTTIHIAPCILVPMKEYEDHCKHTVFEEYLFNAHDGSRLLALGIGSLFNHSRHPNISYRLNLSARTITYSSSHKAISCGDELCIFYGPDEKLWFDMPPEPGVPGSADDEKIDEDEDPESWLKAISCCASSSDEEREGGGGENHSGPGHGGLPGV
mmetsp:Transcript_81184/g.158602  ORF Transcript_81184/g.158602 Transcript_81184/m.158602 type:complete len:189 (+) Transcript_81184:29-595(+)